MRIGLTKQTLDNGGFNLVTTRITAGKIKPQAAKLNAREQQVLDAAAKIASPGEAVSPTAISQRLGIGRNYISMVISKLRAKGVWKYAAPARGRAAGAKAKPVVKVKAEAKAVPTKTPDTLDADIAAIKSTCELLKPMNDESRRRVLECVEAIMLPKISS